MEEPNVKVYECCGKTFKNKLGYQIHIGQYHNTLEQREQRIRERQHKWYEQHKDYSHNDYMKHKKQRLEFDRKYHEQQYLESLQSDGYTNQKKQTYLEYSQQWKTMHKKQNFEDTHKDYIEHKEYYIKQSRVSSWKTQKILNNQGMSFTLEDFNKLWKEQNGKCAICGVQLVQGMLSGNQVKNRFAVDHDHQTGVVRGLLCNTCNIGLHTFERYPKTTLNYLRK
jgi:hypothetical protein